MYGLSIDREHSLSHTKQLEKQFRDAIWQGDLCAGERMPPTRMLAKELGIARNTVVHVYEQLIAEGYLETREGAGTFVAHIGTLRRLSKSKKIANPEAVIKKAVVKNMISFNAGNPDKDNFPKLRWAKLLKEVCQNENWMIPPDDCSGREELKKSIQSYVYRMKGIHCEEEQIIIVPGTAGGIDILVKAMECRYHKIAVEDPCISFVKSIFESHGYEIIPVEVDSQGIKTQTLRKEEGIDFIYTVPSHQFPIGGVLPASRRNELLQYADKYGAYIIEDDYDSEFRYRGDAIQALWNLDPESVIYMGSFSKIFHPSLRMGYMILPKHICVRVTEQMELSNIWVDTIKQLAMAEFMNSKELDRHIYKMKKLYKNKRQYLIDCMQDMFGDHIQVTGEDAGMHLLVNFNRELNTEDFHEMERAGVEADWAEDYAVIKGKNRNRLVLGYGELNFRQIEEGVKRLSFLCKTD